MSNSRDLSLALRLYADSARFVSGLVQGEGAVRRFTGGARREFDAFKRMLGTVQGQLITLGITTGTVATIMQSAKMDKSLTQIGQTAGVSKREVADLRRELFSMSKETGQSVDDLQQGFNNAVQSGLNFREALPVINATNKAVAVTSANAEILTGALTVAGTAFDFDLSKPGMAVELLDKMVVAGRLGNAELENLSAIFGRVGVNAAAAGLGFDKTLAFVETLSLVERSPERLATLADSTLRLFTNLNYAREAANATGVRFFDQATGKQRDPLEVLREIKKQYDAQKTDKDRAMFMQSAFGKADLDTIKGLRTLFGGDMLNKAGEFSRTISAAGGAIDKNLRDAIDNGIDQTGRLKTALREAADGFAKPINATISKWIAFGLDKKSQGGLGLSGGEIIGGGLALTLGTFAAARYGGKAISALGKRFGRTAAGVAEGKALEAAAGVTPVYVVNWPGSTGSGSLIETAAAGVGGAGAGKVASRLKSLAVLAGGLPLSTWGTMGARGLAMAGGGVTAAGAGGYAAGSALNWLLGKGIGAATDGESRNLGELIYQLVHREQKPQEVGGEIRIKVDPATGAVTSVRATTRNNAVPFNMDAGPAMAF